MDKKMPKKISLKDFGMEKIILIAIELYITICNYLKQLNNLLNRYYNKDCFNLYL